MKKALLLAAAFLSACFALSANDQGAFSTKDILLICSHAESSDWAQDMLRPVYELENQRSDIQVFPSFLRMTSLSGPEDLERRKNEIFSAFADKAPSLAVIIGGSGYRLAADIEKQWPGTPVIMAGENDYFCDVQYTIKGTADASAARYPVTGLKIQDGANLTLMHTPAMVEQTVDLMLHILPSMRKLVFIAGENFQSREQQVRLESYLEKTYPGLEYSPILSKDFSTDELIYKLQGEDLNTTGVLFGSWLTHNGYMQTISSRHNVTHIIESIIPVFTLFWSDLDKNRNIAGYYSYDHNLYYSTMQQRIEDVLYNGVKPRDMPFISFAPSSPTLNWSCFEFFGLDTSRIPRNSTILYEPPTFWQSYKK